MCPWRNSARGLNEILVIEEKAPVVETQMRDMFYNGPIRPMIIGKKDTTGLGARTGREVFHMGRGSFNPVISDGRTIFLTGYSSLYALRAAKR